MVTLLVPRSVQTDPRLRHVTVIVEGTHRSAWIHRSQPSSTILQGPLTLGLDARRRTADPRHLRLPSRLLSSIPLDPDPLGEVEVALADLPGVGWTLEANLQPWVTCVEEGWPPEHHTAPIWIVRNLPEEPPPVHTALRAIWFDLPLKQTDLPLPTQRRRWAPNLQAVAPPDLDHPAVDWLLTGPPLDLQVSDLSNPCDARTLEDLVREGALTGLRIENAPGLETLEFQGGPLRDLRIVISEGLQTLRLHDLPELRIATLDTLPGLSELHLERLPAFERLQLNDLPQLETLKVQQAPAFTEIQSLAPPEVSTLDLSDVPRLSSLDLPLTTSPAGVLAQLDEATLTHVPGPDATHSLRFARLTLDTDDLTDADLIRLGAHGGLESLRVASAHVTSAGLDAVIDANPNLQFLALIRVPITDADLQRWASLRPWRGLTLAGVPVTEAGVRAWSVTASLTHLDVADVDLSGATLGPWARTLHDLSVRNSALTELTVHDAPHLHTLLLLGCDQLAHVDLDACPALEFLDLDEAPLRTLRAVDLPLRRLPIPDTLRALTAHRLTLTLLNLDGVPLESLDLAELPNLQLNDRLPWKTLRSLSLTSLDLTDRLDLRLLSPDAQLHLSDLDGLDTLSLRADHWAALPDRAAVCPDLRTLTLEYGVVGDLTDVRDATHLRELTLRHVDDATLDLGADTAWTSLTLEDLPHVEELTVADHPWLERAVLQDLPALRRLTLQELPKLSEVSVARAPALTAFTATPSSRVRLTDLSAAVVASVLPQLAPLEAQLDFRGTNLQLDLHHVRLKTLTVSAPSVASLRLTAPALAKLAVHTPRLGALELIQLPDTASVELPAHDTERLSTRDMDTLRLHAPFEGFAFDADPPLRALILYRPAWSDLAPMAQLPEGLERLELVRPSALRSLGGAPSHTLRSLSLLDAPRLSDLTGLERLPQLARLTITGHRSLKDLTPLLGARLHHLDLEHPECVVLFAALAATDAWRGRNPPKYLSECLRALDRATDRYGYGLALLELARALSRRPGADPVLKSARLDPSQDANHAGDLEHHWRRGQETPRGLREAHAPWLEGLRALLRPRRR